MLSRIQNLPEKIRKIILWIVMVIVALILFSLWINNFKQRIENFNKDQFLEETKINELEF